MNTRVEVLYFASLRDAAGLASETVDTDAPDLAALYAVLKLKHGLGFPQPQLRVAVDGAFARWNDPVQPDTTVAFIPPVSGG